MTDLAKLTDAKLQTRLSELRGAGWSVAVHNDYMLGGARYTFWLWTHPCGRFIKGEGTTDAEAIGICREAARRLAAEGWQDIASAPRDGTSVLIFTTCHGIVEAWFSPGKWETHHEGDEYVGPVWVCADDEFQIEVEEFPEGLHHGTVKGWMPLPAPPKESADG